MGGVVKSIGKGIGSAVKGVSNVLGPAASLAAPFLPGPWGAVASTIGSMGAAGEADKKAAKYEGQVNDIAQKQTGAFNEYYLPLMEQYAKQMGYDPQSGTFHPTSPYGDASRNSYSGIYGTSRYNQGANELDAAADQAVNQIGADSMQRGFTGYNSATDSTIAQARTAEGQQLAALKGGIMMQGEDERYNRERANVDETQRRMQSFLPMLMGAGQSGQGTLAGLGAQYASEANNIGSDIGTMGTALAQGGLFDWLKKKKPQSTSIGTTTANGAPKVKIGNTPAFTPPFVPQAAPNIAGGGGIVMPKRN